MYKLLCALFVIAVPYASFASMEARIENNELHLSLNAVESSDVTVKINVVPETPAVDQNMEKLEANKKQIAELDSFIHREHEAMLVKSGLASHADLSAHQKNISKAQELKRTLALEVIAYDGMGTSAYGSESKGGGTLTLKKAGTYRIPLNKMKQEWSDLDVEQSSAKLKITIKSGKWPFEKTTVINATEAELASGKYQFDIGTKPQFVGGAGTCKQVFK